MKRKDISSGNEFEILFTETAYDLLKNDSAQFIERAMIRLVHSYATIGEAPRTVFLARLPEEKGASDLKYHGEEWYEYRNECNAKKKRVSSGIKRRR